MDLHHGLLVSPLFAWLESTAFSVWVRESPSMFAFPGILTCHTIGMGVAAGINTALALRILGVGPGIPIRELPRFLSIMWFGFWLNAISGVALLVAYPTKAFTNPDFYLKLALIAVAVALVKPISRRASGVGLGSSVGSTLKLLAVASIVCWFGAITAGRLLAYTYTRLLAR
jgi:hypothetical protein